MKTTSDTSYFSSNVAQRVLGEHYQRITGSPLEFDRVPDAVESISEIRHIEDTWMSSEDAFIFDDILPSNSGEFSIWYRKKLKDLNSGITRFLRYLEHEATAEAIAFYVCMEELVDGSFDDIMALAQVGVDNKAKLAIAENYWDEMGNGEFDKIHTLMFETSVNYCKNILEQKKLELPTHTPTQCLMNGNLVFLWALRRKFIPRLFGAIGLIEGSAPLRFRAITRGMERCNFPEAVIAYHREHIRIDAIHGKEWLDRVLMYYVDNDESFCQEVSRGVLIRYRIAEEYYACIEQIVKEKC